MYNNHVFWNQQFLVFLEVLCVLSSIWNMAVYIRAEILHLESIIWENWMGFFFFQDV